MSEIKVKEAKISTLTPDDINANKGTEYGHHLMDKSFRELGAGRSILLDKNNRIIAGNKSVEVCGEIGMDDVIIIETDGTKLVAVKRTDIDLDSEQGRNMALADNATSKANLEWDAEAIAHIQDKFDIDASDWGVKDWEDEENTIDYSGRNKEIDIDELNESMTMSFKFSETEYMFVRDELQKIDANLENSLLKLLRYE